MTCSSCKFYLDRECHRFPPQVSIVMTPTSPQRMALTNSPVITPTPVTCFPSTPEDGWCGEYTLKLQ